MLCIVFYLNLRLKYVVKYFKLFFLNTRRYPWILKKYVSSRITDIRMDMKMGIGGYLPSE